MKPVQDVNGIPSLLGNYLQIRLPHITADKFQQLTPFLAEPAEEPQQRLDRALLPDPQQPLTVAVNLVYQRQILVAPLPGDLINTNGLNAR